MDRPLRFVLLCHQRSGSNALGSLLGQTEGVRLYGQLFNGSREYARYHRADLGLPPFRAHPRALRHFGPRPRLRHRWDALARWGPTATDLSAHLGAFWDRFAQDGDRAVGFKLHDFQLTDADLARLLAEHVDRVLLLHRENLLRAAVSWAVALRTDVWVRKEATASRPPLTLDPDEVAWFVSKTRREVARWREMAAEAGTPTLELTYERDVAPRRLGPISDFLRLGAEAGTPGAATPDFETQRLAAPGYAHVANARELDAALGSDETGWLFDPEAA